MNMHGHVMDALVSAGDAGMTTEALAGINDETQNGSLLGQALWVLSGWGIIDYTAATVKGDEIRTWRVCTK